MLPTLEYINLEFSDLLLNINILQDNEIIHYSQSYYTQKKGKK